ncbi:RibD family protein [Planktothrix pseudagardhii]|uniref:2,5-diamino-6-ribosylamino-4(3H)-pyrimidinone 5'-phosphate reductase n=1 Tax=Planktothrix pseudagardhii TaxID=132604 RepID=A0A9W4CIX7_9CYAN|nr:dihydrofolate reductase family protein [Planktothrix pseudagardhii]CAD5941866.1 2,5-diamino-6-ribosylamino-4(3H)-pyrimidinone 5'-phosphate reductase [Planktothrix pseudagardhii]
MNFQPLINRPHTTVILAMSADGKISDEGRSPARFGSEQDKRHLEQQVAQMDGVLFGAGTLNAYQTTIRITDPELLETRKQQGKPSQPIQIVVSGSGKINPNFRFFQQPVPHWLLTTTRGQELGEKTKGFEKIIIADNNFNEIDWIIAFEQFQKLGLKRLGILGGGQLIFTLLKQNLIDEFWLTICPLILAGKNSPTPADGDGFLSSVAPRLQLLEVKTLGQEVFLHYQVSYTTLQE